VTDYRNKLKVKDPKPTPLIAEVPRNTFANVMIVAPARRELINK
jgi:hypothetical protein